MAKERRQLPGLDWVARDTTYDGMGNVSTVSEWYDESAAGTPALTQYLGYDAFGRPGTIRPPDGTSHDVTMSYTGDRVVQRTVKIATSQTSETGVTKTERYDRQGRLYEYDPLHMMKRLTTPGGGETGSSGWYQRSCVPALVCTSARVGLDGDGPGSWWEKPGQPRELIPSRSTSLWDDRPPHKRNDGRTRETTQMSSVATAYRNL